MLICPLNIEHKNKALFWRLIRHQMPHSTIQSARLSKLSESRMYLRATLPTKTSHLAYL
ncbi:hypothetical protein VIAG107301_19450 [Vibrio agarivorans]